MTRWLLRHALAGLCEGFFVCIGERCGLLAINYVRDRHAQRLPFYGKPPYGYWPHG